MDGKGSLLSQVSKARPGAPMSLLISALQTQVLRLRSGWQDYFAELPSVASSQRGLGGRGFCGGDAEGCCDGSGGRSEGDEGAEGDENNARPDPADERIQECFDDGLAGVRVGAFIDYVQIPAGNGVDGDHGLGLLAGDVDAFLGCHLEELFAVLVDIEKRVLGVVVGVRILGEADTLEGVRADGQCAVQCEFAFFIAVEGRAAQTDDDDYDSDVNEVAAVAPGVAADQQENSR